MQAEIESVRIAEHCGASRSYVRAMRIARECDFCGGSGRAYLRVAAYVSGGYRAASRACLAPCQRCHGKGYLTHREIVEMRRAATASARQAKKSQALFDALQCSRQPVNAPQEADDAAK